MFCILVSSTLFLSLKIAHIITDLYIHTHIQTQTHLNTHTQQSKYYSLQPIRNIISKENAHQKIKSQNLLCLKWTC